MQLSTDVNKKKKNRISRAVFRFGEIITVVQQCDSVPPFGKEEFASLEF